MGKEITKDTVITHDSQGRPASESVSKVITAMWQGLRQHAEDKLKEEKPEPKKQ